MLEKIFDVFDHIMYELKCYIDKYLENASFKNKICTLILIIIALIFGGLNIWQEVKKEEMLSQAQNTVDSAVNPLLEEIEEVKSFDSVMDVSEIKNSMSAFFEEIRSLLYKLCVMLVTIIIGIIVSIIKNPFETIKSIIHDLLEGDYEDAYLYVPMSILFVIDTVEFALNFL